MVDLFATKLLMAVLGAR
jgi:phospholipid/cholesterol/gamma-HCH transport system ATP-binding protein